MPKIKNVDGKFYFDADDGSAMVECPIWIETSKKNDMHPEGKPWIKLPKGNVANRQYFSKELFESTNVDGVVEVEVKTSGPRVLGSSGVKQAIVKYLDEATAAEYTALVNTAVEAYKAAKGSSKAKKPEDMSVEELEAYIDALKNGKSFSAGKTGPHSFMDMFTEEQYARYNDILALAQERKANAPRVKHGPLTDEEKANRAAKRKVTAISKAEKLLEALRAGTPVVDEATVEADDISDIADAINEDDAE